MATISAVVVDPDGTARKAQVENDLAGFQAVVGGYVEIVTGDIATIYVNEDGKPHGLPFNSAATGFARTVLSRAVMLVGTVLIVGPADEDGNDTDVRPGVVDYYQLEN